MLKLQILRIIVYHSSYLFLFGPFLIAKLLLIILHIASVNSFSETTPSQFLSASLRSYSQTSLSIFVPPYEQNKSLKSSKDILPSPLVSKIQKATLTFSQLVMAFRLILAVKNSQKSISPFPFWSHSSMTLSQLILKFFFNFAWAISSNSSLPIVPDLSLSSRLNSF